MNQGSLAKLMVLAFVIMLLGSGCRPADSLTADLGFEQSDLPGGGIRIPHNDRLHLSTDQKWIEREGHLSDLIRLQWTAERAKPAIVWVDEQGHDKTAIISHDKANDPSQQDHKHISFETTMSPSGSHAGQLFTRFEIPYDTDISEIRTHSANFNVMNGILRVAGEQGTDRDMQLGVSGDNNAVAPRWSMRADRTEETGTNEGSNLQLVRYNDEGQALDATLTIERSSGNVGIATTEPENKLDVNDDRIRIRESYTPASSGDPCKQGQLAWDNQFMYVCVSENQWHRAELSTW
jgi:hypothetical protein